MNDQINEWVSAFLNLFLGKEITWYFLYLETERDVETLSGKATSPRTHGCQVLVTGSHPKLNDSRSDWQARAASLLHWKHVHLLCHSVLVDKRKAGDAGPPSAQVDRPLPSTSPSLYQHIWKSMNEYEYKRRDSSLGVEEVRESRDGELTIQAAKFNLREFGSVLSINNTVRRKSMIPKTK